MILCLADPQHEIHWKGFVSEHQSSHDGLQKPSDTEVLDAIRDALRRHGVVNSQRKMTELVLKELHRHDSDYSVGEQRVRKLAIGNDLAR